MTSPEAEIALVERSLAAIRTGDTAGLGALLHPEVELRTRRGVIRGRAAVEAWAGMPPYEHLDVEIGPSILAADGDRVIARHPVRLRWRETGEIADESPATLIARFSDGLIAELTME